MRVAEQIEPRQAVTQPPTPPPWRSWKAYAVTFQILCSYLWLRLLSRVHSTPWGEEQMELTHRRNARRIYRAISELQGLYIKVGQLISIMTNFLPEVFRGELQGLQDKVPPRPYDAIERRFRDEFGGRGPQEIFESFDEVPVASASMGQVHLARLQGGMRVAVKVQYPDIDKIVKSDLRTLRRIFAIIERFIAYRGLNLIYQEICSMILQELDFTTEAKNVRAIAQNFATQENVGFPKVVWELSNQKILTTEYIEGVKVNDLYGLQQLGIDRQQLAQLVIETYCQQIFHHGHYHADPHPGNILVRPGPAITFLDFGAVAEISEGMRKGILLLLQGAINRDTVKLVEALRQMGFIAHHADPRIYEQVIDYFHTRFQEEVTLESFSLKDIKFDPQKGLENIADLRQMDISLADITDTFHVPKEWIMLERTILLLMGLCTELAPELNPMDILRPHVEQFVLGKDGDWSQFILDTVRDLTLSALALPQEIKKFTSNALRGNIEIGTRDVDGTGWLYFAIGHQLIYAAFVIAGIAFGLNYENRGIIRVAHGFYAAAGGFGLLLLYSFWRSRRWMKRHFGKNNARRGIDG
jgi:predicted unusual protein kinase regulating ubiquinone biosynthesis (AarF/ABC1/UbiB family)